jgi:hypothetical protein
MIACEFHILNAQSRHEMIGLSTNNVINLGSMLLCIMSYNQLNNWWQKWINFVKLSSTRIKILMTLHKKKKWIENGFQFNCKEIGCKLVKKVLQICLCIWCWENIFKFFFWKDKFPCFFNWEWIKHIPIWNYSNDNLQFRELQVVLFKPTSMNHGHWNYIILFI